MENNSFMIQTTIGINNVKYSTPIAFPKISYLFFIHIYNLICNYINNGDLS